MAPELCLRCAAPFKPHRLLILNTHPEFGGKLMACSDRFSYLTVCIYPDFSIVQVFWHYRRIYKVCLFVFFK